MAEGNALVWDAVGKKLYHTGVDKTVLFPVNDEGAYQEGIAWNGITAINNNPSGADPTDLYADNIKYVTLRSAEDCKGTIEAYMYPDEWGECDGSAEIAPGVRIGQQTRKAFGLCYRTKVGNDTAGEDFGYILHFVYGATVSPSQKQNQTINDNPNANTMSWEFSTTPVNVAGFKPTAYLEVESWNVTKEKLEALEAIVYGGTTKSRLPLPDEIKSLMAA